MRWSARRKEEVVLRLLRGESLDLLARESALLADLQTVTRVGPAGRAYRRLA
jgi:hypothetical protein